MATSKKQVLVYLEPGLKDWLRQAAKADSRSITSYVEQLIKRERDRVSQK